MRQHLFQYLLINRAIICYNCYKRALVAPVGILNEVAPVALVADNIARDEGRVDPLFPFVNQMYAKRSSFQNTA